METEKTIHTTHIFSDNAGPYQYWRRIGNSEEAMTFESLDEMVAWVMELDKLSERLNERLK